MLWGECVVGVSESFVGVSECVVGVSESFVGVSVL